MMMIFYHDRRLLLFIFLWGISVEALYAQGDTSSTQPFKDYDTKIELFIQQATAASEVTTYIQAAHTLRFFIQMYESYAPCVNICSPENKNKFSQFERYVSTAYALLDDTLFMLQYEKDRSGDFINSVERIHAFFNAELLFLHTLGDGNADRIIIPLPISSPSQPSHNSSIVSTIVVVVSVLGSFVFYFALRDFFTTQYSMKLDTLEKDRDKLNERIKKLNTDIKSNMVFNRKEGLQKNVASIREKLNNLEGELETMLKQPIGVLRAFYEKRIVAEKLGSHAHFSKYKEKIEEAKKGFNGKIQKIDLCEGNVRILSHEQSKYGAAQIELYRNLCGLKKRVGARLTQLGFKSDTPPGSLSPLQNFRNLFFPDVIRKFRNWHSSSAWAEAELAFPPPVAAQSALQ